MKTLMILGVGRGQVGLYKAAKKLGYRTIAASIPGNYPGFAYADEICYVNIIDKEAVCEAAKRFNVDGIASACIDAPMKALGYTCDTLGLPGISETAAELSVDKLAMKEALIEAGVTVADYRRIVTEEDLNQALEELDLPLIIKAVDLAGSRGINNVFSRGDAPEAFARTMAATRRDYCIIEEFIEGYKFGCTAFVADGEIMLILPCGDVTFSSNTVIPVGHFVPLDFSVECGEDTDNEAVYREIEKEMYKAVGAMGFTDCAVNADLILKDGKVYMLEVTGRMGANALPELTSIYYGIDIYELIAMQAMRDPELKGRFREALQKEGRPCRAEMVISHNAGTLKELTYDGSTEVEEVLFFAGKGDKVNAFRNTKDCLGQIIVSGDTPQDCETALANACRGIKLVLE